VPQFGLASTQVLLVVSHIWLGGQSEFCVHCGEQPMTAQAAFGLVIVIPAGSTGFWLLQHGTGGRTQTMFKHISPVGQSEFFKHCTQVPSTLGMLSAE